MSSRATRARNVRRVWLGALVLAAVGFGVTLAGVAQHRAHQPAAVTAPGRVVLAASAGTAHPQGPDESPTRPRTPWSGPGSVPMWHGGGRHPIWRGCQHVYDPALGKFIFSKSSTT